MFKWTVFFINIIFIPHLQPDLNVTENECDCAPIHTYTEETCTTGL